MNIAFRHQGEISEQDALHLVQLFFEQDIQLQFSVWQEEQLDPQLNEDREEISIYSSVQYTKAQEIVAQVVILDKHKRKEHCYRKAYSTELSEKELFKLAKQCSSHALVKTLEEWTGIKQPWGILTGVRPTKIMHRYRLEQKSKQEIKAYFEDHLLLSGDKVELLQHIVDRQLKVVPDFDRIDQEVSIYVGIPFCPTKCAYCTFPAYAINRKGSTVEQFLTGLALEIEKVGQWLQEHQIKITTIYLGGGTPTSIEAEEMDYLFQCMEQHFGQLDHVRELTVEAGRPDTITPEKLEVLKKWGVDRISINPQSFTQETLDVIGRHHTVEETVEKYALARKYGLNNINMDLIIGLPGEGITELQHSLDQVEQLRPESLTVHTLSFKRASTMTRNKEKYTVAGRDEIKQMMEMATQWTKREAYHAYYLYRQKNILGNLENVGYALEGQESIYNIMIMEEAQTIIGLGCGAVSKIIPPQTKRNTRWPNPKDPKTYIDTYEEMIKKKINDLNRLYGF